MWMYTGIGETFYETSQLAVRGLMAVRCKGLLYVNDQQKEVLSFLSQPGGGISLGAPLSLQLEGLKEKQAAHTYLLKEVIQCLDAFECKFDERRPQEKSSHVHKRSNVGIAVS